MEEQIEKKRILFVDDDEGLRSLCSEVLTNAGYNVVAASDGTEAYWKIKESEFDLVITGMRLPGLDGMGLYLNTLKAYASMKEKFLFMTEDACADLEGHSVITMLNEKYLIKPFDVKELLKKVEGATGANLSAFFAMYRGLDDNRRKERRLCWAEDCLVEDDASPSRPFAQTSDISKHGIRIRYMGAPLNADATVFVIIRLLSVRSRGLIVWSLEINGIEAVSGLKLYDPISAASLSVILQRRKIFVPPLVSGEEER